MEELFSEERGKYALLAEAIDIETLAIIITAARSIEADKDRFGNTIQGSKKKKIIAYLESMRLSAVQKHMLLGALGYRNTNAQDKVQAYVNTLSLSSDEKQMLMKYSGYAA